MLLVATAAQPAGESPETACLCVLDPAGGQIRARVRLLPAERVCSLATWYVRGPKTYRYVCVGTAQLAPAPAPAPPSGAARGARPPAGRLVIYSLKPPKRRPRARAASPPPPPPGLPPPPPDLELKYVWESARASPVAALASLGDAYLVVAAGAQCVVLRLDVDQKQVVECCACDLRFAVTSLDVRGTSIVAGSELETVAILRFTPGDDRLDLVHCARFGLATADARFLAPDLVAGVDRRGYVYVVGIPHGPSEFALDFALGFHLRTECSRIRIGRLARHLHASRFVLPWSARSPDAAAHDHHHPDCLVVTTVDGALWTVARITDDAFELLRLLEAAMRRMPPLHPARPLFADDDAAAARASARIPSANVANGPLLALFADALTEAEQAQVVAASPDLGLLARDMAARSASGSSTTTTAGAFIARLIHELAWSSLP